MTSSKSDLEAKEGQIPNESNFLEFVSLLGSLSTRAGGPSTQEDKGSEHKEEVETAEEGESQKEGFFIIIYLILLFFTGSEKMPVLILKCNMLKQCRAQYSNEN